jgi:hypothetical protein
LGRLAAILLLCAGCASPRGARRPPSAVRAADAMRREYAIVLLDRRGAVRHVHAGYRGEGDAEIARRELLALLEGR